MSKTNLYDALELSLQALDGGEDLESCLARYPEWADGLRPILTAAIQARSAAVIDVPASAVRRGKARLLQAAAQMREQDVQEVHEPGRFGLLLKGFFGPRFFRLALTSVLVLAFLLTGGTGLVNASTSSLPGDQLYPVKRSWEGVQLLFVFDSEVKEELEQAFEHERYKEIEELYSEKRIAEVDFQGVVQQRDQNILVVNGVRIKIDDHISLPDTIVTGATVRVIGETDDGLIEAKQVLFLAAPGLTPMPTLAPVDAPISPKPLDELQKPESSDPVKSSDDGKDVKPGDDEHSGDGKSGGSDDQNDGSDDGNSNDAGDEGNEDKDSGGGDGGSENNNDGGGDNVNGGGDNENGNGDNDNGDGDNNNDGNGNDGGGDNNNDGDGGND